VAEIVILGGLRITSFIEPARYAPENYLSDATLRARVDALDGLERACFAELLAGNLSKHIFYVVEAANPVEPPEPDEEEAVPVFRDAETAAQARKLESGGTITASRDGTHFRFPLPRLARAIAERIDGRRTLREIHEDIAAAAPPGPEPEDFYRQFTELFDALNALNMLYLRIPPTA
jgi:hypothetical protein